MGSIPSFRASRLFDPADPLAVQLQSVISKWTQFYAQFRGILTGKMLHLRRPDSKNLEATLHIAFNAAATDGQAVDVVPPYIAMLSLTNPNRNTTLTQKTLTVPLYYTGLYLCAIVVMCRTAMKNAYSAFVSFSLTCVLTCVLT